MTDDSSGADSILSPTDGEAMTTGPLSEQIWQLLSRQRFAVLSTQGGGQPYASLVCLAASPDLGSLLFATPVATRKYRLLSECGRVAILVDDRDEHREMMSIEAVTVTGIAGEVPAGEEWRRWAALLLDRHPHLSAFVNSPTSALFRVAALRYFHVHRFQEVRQWTPPRLPRL